MRRFSALSLPRFAMMSYDTLAPFGQRRKARFFNGRDIDEHVLGAPIRLDKTVTLGRIEPLNRSTWHCRLRYN